MSDKTLDYFLHENKCSPDEAKSLMFHLSTIRTRKLNEAIESYQFICVKCMVAHKTVYNGCDFHNLQQQNEIYRKSNDIYKKALDRIVTDSGGGSKVNHLNMVESCIKCARQALQDAQKLAGGK